VISIWAKWLERRRDRLVRALDRAWGWSRSSPRIPGPAFCNARPNSDRPDRHGRSKIQRSFHPPDLGTLAVAVPARLPAPPARSRFHSEPGDAATPARRNRHAAGADRQSVISNEPVGDSSETDFAVPSDRYSGEFGNRSTTGEAF